MNWEDNDDNWEYEDNLWNGFAVLAGIILLTAILMKTFNKELVINKVINKDVILPGEM